MSQVSPTPPNGDKRIVVYVAPTSPANQFAAKVLVALDSRQLQHYLVYVPLRPSKRKLSSGRTMVPECQIGASVVADSEAILRHLDEHLGTDFFPNELAGELSRRATDGVLPWSARWHYILHAPTYARTTRVELARGLPACLCCLRGVVIDKALAKMRVEFREPCAKALGLELSALADEAEVRAKLSAELHFFQSQLKSPDQPYLVPGTTRPTAADCSAYTAIERLVSTMGDNPQVQKPALTADDELLAAGGPLARLWKWHREMRAKHPIRWRGKRLPAQATAS